MKKLLWGTVFLALVIAAPLPATAGVDISVHIPLPPPIFFGAPPQLIVLPETYVYVAPDADVDIFFYDGWWWRPWEGRWYRSAYYDSGWAYYDRVPVFYRAVPSGWRNDYRDHRWRGHEWDYQRIPHQQVQQNWRGWKQDRHWEKQQTWGVKGLQPRTGAPRPPRDAQQTRQPRSSVREDRPERPQQRREAGPRSRDDVRQQRREAGPRSGDAVKQQRRDTGPPSREATKQKRKKEAPRSREEQPQQGDHERGEGGGHLRR